MVTELDIAFSFHRDLSKDVVYGTKEDALAALEAEGIYASGIDIEQLHRKGKYAHPRDPSKGVAEGSGCKAMADYGGISRAWASVANTMGGYPFNTETVVEFFDRNRIPHPGARQAWKQNSETITMNLCGALLSALPHLAALTLMVPNTLFRSGDFALMSEWGLKRHSPARTWPSIRTLRIKRAACFRPVSFFNAWFSIDGNIDTRCFPSLWNKKLDRGFLSTEGPGRATLELAMACLSPFNSWVWLFLS